MSWIFEYKVWKEKYLKETQYKYFNILYSHWPIGVAQEVGEHVYMHVDTRGTERARNILINMLLVLILIREHVPIVELREKYHLTLFCCLFQF